MKVGDLVTLSSYGRRMRHASRCMMTRQYRNNNTNPLIGLLISVQESTYSWQTQSEYVVAWVDSCDAAPKGRDSYQKYFHRKDLKLVKRAK